MAVLLAASLWGSTGTAQQLGPESSTALGVGALRLVIGGSCLVAIAAATGGLREQPWRATRSVLTLGGVFVAIYQLAFFEATRRAGVAPATVITIASAPVFSTVLHARRGQRPSRTAAGALGLTIIGVALLGLSAGSGEGTSPALGVACALVSGLGYASYADLGRRAIDLGMHSTTSMAALFCGGALIASATLPWQPLGWLSDGDGLLMLLHLAVITLGLGYALYGWGLQRLPVPTVVTLTLAEPVVAAVLAVLVLDEPLPVIGWFGVAIVVAGLAVTGRDAATDDPSASDQQAETRLPSPS